MTGTGPIEARLGEKDAVLAVDVQNDFCAGGALPVPDGDAVVAELNRWIAAAERAGAVVVASRDWHPVDHSSFDVSGGPWPPHCVRSTEGAEYRSDLNLPASTLVVSKGTHTDHDNYSAFEESGLAERLRAAGVERLWVGGLAQDYCVRATVLDAIALGFEVHLIRAATRPVERSPGDGDRALGEMRQAGAVIEG